MVLRIPFINKGKSNSPASRAAAEVFANLSEEQFLESQRYQAWPDTIKALYHMEDGQFYKFLEKFLAQGYNLKGEKVGEDVRTTITPNNNGLAFERGFGDFVRFENRDKQGKLGPILQTFEGNTAFRKFARATQASEDGILNRQRIALCSYLTFISRNDYPVYDTNFNKNSDEDDNRKRIDRSDERPRGITESFGDLSIGGFEGIDLESLENTPFEKLSIGNKIRIPPFSRSYNKVGNTTTIVNDTLMDFLTKSRAPGHKHRAERLKHVMGPVLKVLGANPRLKALYDEGAKKFKTEAFKEGTDLSITDEGLHRQFTRFFSTIGSSPELMKLFYETAMVIAKRESDERRERLLAVKGPIKLSGIRVGLGVNGGIAAETERMLYPNKADDCLHIGLEEWFGGSFNLGGYFNSAFFTNSRVRGVNMGELPWPTFKGSINPPGLFSIFGEADITGNMYATDQHWAFEIFAKEFFHANHLFGANAVRQVSTGSKRPGEAYKTTICRKPGGRTIDVLTDDMIYTPGGGRHRIGCKNMDSDSYEVTKERAFNTEFILQDVLAYMQTDEYKSGKSPSQSFEERFPRTPTYMTSQQVLMLAKYPNFPFDVLFRGTTVAQIGDADSGNVVGERQFVRPGGLAQTAFPPKVFIVGPKAKYKQEAKKAGRPRYNILAPFLASSDGSTENYTEIPINGYTESLSSNDPRKRFLTSSGVMTVELNPNAKITKQIREDPMIEFSKKSDKRSAFISYDLVVDCSGLNGDDELQSTICTKEASRIDDLQNNPNDLDDPGYTKRRIIRAMQGRDGVVSPGLSFELMNGSRFQIRSKDNQKVVLGSYNSESRTYEEYEFFRGDFDFILEAIVTPDGFKPMKEISARSNTNWRFFLRSLGLLQSGGQETFFESIKSIVKYEQINDTFITENYVEGENKWQDELIKSVFGDKTKLGIEFAKYIDDEALQRGVGTRLMGPVGKSNVPLSVFEKEVLVDTLGIAENTAARFRYRRRIVCEFYRDYDKRVVSDYITSGEKSILNLEDKEGVTPKQVRKLGEFGKGIKVSGDRIEKLGGIDVLLLQGNEFENDTFDTYFRALVADAIDNLRIDAKLFSKGDLHGYHVCPKINIVMEENTPLNIVRENGIDRFYEIEATANASQIDELSLSKFLLLELESLFDSNKIFAGLVSKLHGRLKRAKTKQSKGYIIKKSGFDLHIPLIEKDGYLVLDTGGVDRVRLDQTVSRQRLKNSILETFGSKDSPDGPVVVEEVFGGTTYTYPLKDKKQKRKVPTQLPYRDAEFGFYDKGKKL